MGAPLSSPAPTPGGRLRPLLWKGAGALVLLVVAIWLLRVPLSRLFPIEHEGEVLRIASFNKGGFSRAEEGTRQLNQFAIIFADGFDCEGTDTSFAAIEEGDRILVRGYHDVRGIPIIDPEWWECEEAQFIRIVAPAAERR